MKKLYSIVLAALLVSCASPLLEFNDPDLDISYKFQDLQEAWEWIAYYVKYMPDGFVDTWQRPATTRTSLAGDCEDFTLLFMHLAKRMGYDPVFAIKGFASSGHALMVIDGRAYDAQCPGITFQADPSWIYLSYEQAMRKAQ